MRPADPERPEYHLLEELAKPAACVTAGKISIWVYRDNGSIREIVLSGHAESRTCSAATSLLIEAVKELGPNVRWMLTCGAAHFEMSEDDIDVMDPARMLPKLAARGLLSHNNPEGMMRELESRRVEAKRNQQILHRLVSDFARLADERGLAQVFVRSWATIAAFRREYESRRGASPPLIVLPSNPGNGRVAMFVPIVADSDPERRPVIFHLEGWDYDCSGYQRVADIHLRQMWRELLSDALRRRRVYRRWLQTWIERWIGQLSWLPKKEAEATRLHVPPPSESQFSKAQIVGPADFLQNHISSFIDRSRKWPRLQMARFSQLEYGRMSVGELDDPFDPGWITVVDFERGTEETRRTTKDDPKTSHRKGVTENMPSLINRCLLFIRRMDAIIGPYEALRVRRGVARKSQDGPGNSDEGNMRLLDEISRRIVLETMIRGWPSFYLEDEQDKDAFRKWAEEYRPRVWALFGDQAARAGIRMEQLLEDNVIYDVRFDEDLGCVIQPLVLVDDAAHAQSHGNGAGASAVVPLWNRCRGKPMPAEVMALGPTNRARAEQLVYGAAARLRTKNVEFCETRRAIAAGRQMLRSALACHPARAGRLILEEWARRLGRDTHAEFRRARQMIEAADLCSRFRFKEASQRVGTYLADESEPVRDAFVIAAICEVSKASECLTDLRESAVRCDALKDQGRELLPKIEALKRKFPTGSVSPGSLTPEEQADLRRWHWINEELERAENKFRTLEQQTKSLAEERRSLIEKALSGADISDKYPALAQAASKARQELQASLKCEGMYGEDCVTQEFLNRYYLPLRGLVRLLGLLEIVYQVSKVIHCLEEDPIAARSNCISEMKRLADDLWLPEKLEDEFRQVTEEFGKGEWDRLQSQQILGFLRDANKTCQEDMESLINKEEVLCAPYAEALYARIHLIQIFLGHYSSAFQELLTATIPLAHAIRGKWEILDGKMSKFPEGGSLRFDRSAYTVTLDSRSGSTPILRACCLADGEVDYLAKVFADHKFLSRLSSKAPTITEAVLGAKVAPSREWRLWRATFKGLRSELIAALSVFGFEANLMPEYSPNLEMKAQAWLDKLDTLPPVSAPLHDWKWTKLGHWEALIGSDTRRVQGAIYDAPRKT